MKKFAALIVFIALVGSTCLAMDLSLAPGLSVKNLLLYVLVVWIVFEAVIDSSEGGLLKRQFDYVAIHVGFIILIIAALLSAAVCVFVIQYKDYGPVYAVITLKAALIDHYLMLFVFLAAIRDSKEAIWMAKAILVLLTIAMTLSLIDMFGFMALDIMAPRADGRLQGPALGANEYAALMAFFLPIALVFTYLDKGWARTFWIISVFVYLMVLFYSGSRGGLIGLIGGACIGLVLFRQNVKTRYVVQTVVGTLVVAGLAVALLSIQHSDLLYARFIESTVTSNTFDQTSGRTEIWGDAIWLMSETPITFFVGFGWATFDLMNEFGSHNVYLQYLFELGIVCLSVVIFIYLTVIVYVVSAARWMNVERRLILMGFLFGFLGILLSITFNHMAAPWLFIWGTVGTMLRLACAERNVAPASGNPESPRVKVLPSLRYAKSQIKNNDL